MKKIVIKNPRDVVIEGAEYPKLEKGYAILKMLYGGICGSDLGSYRGSFAYFQYPRTPGHEISAQIVEIDENDKGLKPGMLVTCNPYFNCGQCYSCQKGLVNACESNQTMGVQRDGAFYEYIKMPIERIYDASGLTPKQAALIEPFCIGWHGAKRGEVKSGDNVLVIGAGTIGVFTAIAAKAKGAKVYISDVIENKLKMVTEEFGFDGYILNDSKENFRKSVKNITNGNGFDVCLEAVGLSSTFQSCIDSACFGGKIVLIGVSKQKLDFDFTIIQKKELNIYGSRNALKEDFIDLIELVKKGNIKIDSVITHVYKFEDVKTAFKDFDNPKQEIMLKVLLDFTNGEDYEKNKI